MPKLKIIRGKINRMKRPKFIRGVPGRGVEILHYFQDKGYECNGYTGEMLSKADVLFLVYNNKLSHTSKNCFTGQILLVYGEEVSIDDLITFKFNIGEAVTMFLPALNIKKTSIVRERYYKNGVPYYKLKNIGFRGTFNLPEDQLNSDPLNPIQYITTKAKPALPRPIPKYKEGDKVTHLDTYNKIYTILGVVQNDEQIFYNLLNSSGEFSIASEDKLDLCTSLSHN